MDLNTKSQKKGSSKLHWTKGLRKKAVTWKGEVSEESITESVQMTLPPKAPFIKETVLHHVNRRGCSWTNKPNKASKLLFPHGINYYYWTKSSQNTSEWLEKGTQHLHKASIRKKWVKYITQAITDLKEYYKSEIHTQNKNSQENVKWVLTELREKKWTKNQNHLRRPN